MYFKQTKGYVVKDNTNNVYQKELINFFKPDTHESSDYVNWIAVLDLKTCLLCRLQHGKIYDIDEIIEFQPPVHNLCRCDIKKMDAVFAGGATEDGIGGPDFYLKYNGVLPDIYLTKAEAKKLGWKSYLGNLFLVAPGKSIGGDVYKNRNGHLPQKDGRIWYEADINYDFGLRGSCRLLYSNDGLIFATYNHYQTFVQVE